MKKLLLAATFLIFVFTSCTEEPIPIVYFTVSGANAPAPAYVTFTNTSIDSETFLWEFGDGTTSTEKNVSHTYSNGGNYTVKLTAYNGKQSNSKTANITVLAPVPNPVANFSFTEIGNFAPSKVSFNNISNNANTYSWDFGNGKTSTELNPVVLFTNGGTFNVTLKVKNSVGVESIINKSVVIKNAPTKLKVNSILLTAYPLNTATGGNWDFTNGPDMFFLFSNSNNVTLFQTSSTSDTKSTDLPISFNSGFPYSFDSFNTKYSISLYDEDGISAKDFMAGYSFQISDMIPTDGTKYPSQLNFNSTTSSLKFILNFDWAN